MWSRSEIKTRAKRLLNIHYWKAVLVSLIFCFVSGGSSSISSSDYDSDTFSFSFDAIESEIITIFTSVFALFLIIVLIVLVISMALSFLVFCPLQVGCQRFFVFCDNGAPSLNDVVFAFSDSYWNVVKIMFFRNLYTFLWSLLLIVPGIIKGYEYRMIPYILAENPSISKEDAFALSKQMMDGDKLNAWILDLSFLGWNILGILTCCTLSVFYVLPYQNLTNAQLYLSLKQKVTGNGYHNGSGYSGNPYAQNPYANPDNGNYYDNPYLS